MEEQRSENLSHPDPKNDSENSHGMAKQEGGDPVDADPVDAILVEAEGAPSHLALAPPMARNMENMAAKGGAIGAVVLGVLALTGSFVTNFSLINGVMGLLMGVWGLSSQKRRTAWIGITLCLIGILLCVIHVGDIVADYLREIDGSEFEF